MVRIYTIIEQPEQIHKCIYPAKVSVKIQCRRLKNIQTEQQLIEEA